MRVQTWGCKHFANIQPFTVGVLAHAWPAQAGVQALQTRPYTADVLAHAWPAQAGVQAWPALGMGGADLSPTKAPMVYNCKP